MLIEVYIFNATSIHEEQTHDETTLPRFPSVEFVKKEIAVTVPNIFWIDETTAQINNSDFQGQIILSDRTDFRIIYFRIAGGLDPFKVLLDLCVRNNWTSYTPENGHFLDLKMDTLKYWQEYQTYKGFINDVFNKSKSN